MLIKQGLDQVQLVRNAMKRELSLTVSGLFNPLNAQNELKCEKYKEYLCRKLVNLKEVMRLLELLVNKAILSSQHLSVFLQATRGQKSNLGGGGTDEGHLNCENRLLYNVCNFKPPY